MREYPDVSITFACYNQVEYTRQCIESMQRTHTPLHRVVAVDNASSDSTLPYLESLPLGRVIHNANNLGCGVAWNQGALEQQAEWTIVMNNDVIVGESWVEGLINAAVQHKLDIVSPAMIEGELDYDFPAFATKAREKMGNVMRIGWAHAVCLAVHRRVWQEIGYFRANPKLLGYEDAIFFQDAQQAGLRIGVTGASWLHHFGSITQSAMKQERGLQQKSDLGNRSYNLSQLRQSFIKRKLNKFRLMRMKRHWHDQEIEEHGMALWGRSQNGQIIWRRDR
ncbi:glycosyltransferase [Leptospira sp. 96542]|nr:glycosyltransferase [Leptospira sp. 96542]